MSQLKKNENCKIIIFFNVQFELAQALVRRHATHRARNATEKIIQKTKT